MELKGHTARVCGAGGFIGGYLAKHLINNRSEVVRAVDIKPLDEWYQTTDGVENLSLELKDHLGQRQADAFLHVHRRLRQELPNVP